MTTTELKIKQAQLEAWQERMAFRILASECLIICIGAAVLLWSFLK